MPFGMPRRFTPPFIKNIFSGFGGSMFVGMLLLGLVTFVCMFGLVYLGDRI